MGGSMKKSEFIFIVIILLIVFIGALVLFGYELGAKSTKPTQIIKEVKIVDTEALQKLQAQFNQLQVEYDTFEHYLEGYERGWYDGHMKAKSSNDFITDKILYPHMTIKNNSPNPIYVYTKDKEYNGYVLNSGSIITTSKKEIIIRRK